MGNYNTKYAGDIGEDGDKNPLYDPNHIAYLDPTLARIMVTTVDSTVMNLDESNLDYLDPSERRISLLSDQEKDDFFDSLQPDHQLIKILDSINYIIESYNIACLEAEEDDKEEPSFRESLPDKLAMWHESEYGDEKDFKYWDYKEKADMVADYLESIHNTHIK